MGTIHVAVLDDNEEFLHGFAKMLAEEFHNCNIDAKTFLFSKAEPFLDHLKNNNGVDLCFLDILLPDHHGVSLAKILQTQFPRSRVIFMSGVAATAADIFDADPSYFLIKPILPQRLHTAVSAAMQEKPCEFLTIRSKGQMLRLSKSTLEYVEIMGRTLTFHGLDYLHSTSGRLDAITRLLGEDFIRCHKSYTANLKLVHQIDKTDLVFFSEKRIPIARPKLPEVREKFFSYFAVGKMNRREGK